MIQSRGKAAQEYDYLTGLYVEDTDAVNNDKAVYVKYTAITGQAYLYCDSQGRWAVSSGSISNDFPELATRWPAEHFDHDPAEDSETGNTLRYRFPKNKNHWNDDDKTLKIVRH